MTDDELITQLKKAAIHHNNNEYLSKLLETAAIRVAVLSSELLRKEGKEEIDERWAELIRRTEITIKRRNKN